MDNTTISLATDGDVIRDIDRAGVKTPVSLIDVGGAGGEVLLSDASPMPVKAASLPLPEGAASEATLATLAKDSSLEGLATEITLAALASSVAKDTSLASLLAAVSDLASAVATEATLGALKTAVAKDATVSALAGVLASETTLEAVLSAVATETTLEALSAKVATEATLSALAAKVTTCDTGQVTVSAPLPSGTNRIGGVVSAPETGVVYSSGVALVPKFAKIAATGSGQTEVVAGVAGKKIRVMRYGLSVGSEDSAQFFSGGTTALTGLKYGAGKGPLAGGAYCPLGIFETASGESLTVQVAGGGAVGGDLTYLEV